MIYVLAALPGCQSAAITVTKLVTVTVQSQSGQPYPDLPVYIFTGAAFTLLQGEYRFRADYDGVPFWSGEEDTCVLPGCETAVVTLPGGSGERDVTIDYEYDALNRLTAARYSNGIAFAYTYDTAGNVLDYTASVNGQVETTAYTYDAANQLRTAEKGGVIWQYSYDGNGSLIQTTPGEEVGNGAKRYSYNTAGFLVKVETYTIDWQAQAEMAYDGLGNRLAMTGYADGQSVTTTYALDSGQTLPATAGEMTTASLYGLGAIGEQTDTWAYPLLDGANTARQMVNAEGEVTLTTSCTPWGDTLEVHGTGSFTSGYFGGIMDAATGLLYVGNGHYYDPATGRFLTRDAKPNQTNPYVPWKSDPAGAIVAPLALLALVYGGKKKRGKWDNLLILLVLCGAVGMSLSACGGPKSSPASDTNEISIFVESDGNISVRNAAGTVIATMPLPSEAPTITPTACEVEATRIPTITPTPLPTCQVCTSNQYAQMLYDAILKQKNDLPDGFSVALLFAMAAVESGGNSEQYRNSITQGGAFQLRSESGHYHHPYADTSEGYDQNVADAIAVVKENYGYAAATTGEENWRMHFLYTNENGYPDNPNEVTAARTVLFYNGGMGWYDPDNKYSYVHVRENRPYVGNVANMLESYVPRNFGFSDPLLVNILRSIQTVVNYYVP